MKTIVSLLLICFTTSGLCAQDMKAKEIMESSIQTFNSLEDISANLKVTVEDPNWSNPDVRSGELVISGEKYRMILEDRHLYCDAASIWVVLIFMEEMNIIHYNPEGGSSNNIVYHTYTEDSEARYDGLVGGLHTISLFWDQPDNEYIQAQFSINPDTKIVEKSVFSARNGIKITNEYSNIVTNTAVSEDAFKPDMSKYIDFTIVDER